MEWSNQGVELNMKELPILIKSRSKTMGGYDYESV
jgi:hypothetical protein